MPIAANPVRAPAAVLTLLDQLHRQSEEQEATLRSGQAKLANKGGDDEKQIWSESNFKQIMADKFIALDQDKCQFMYSLLRGTGGTTVVEAGTSYGVSTIYLALAVAQNLANKNTAGSATTSRATGKVIATEHEPEKAKKARQHWAQCGQDVEQVIELREGDLLQTLQAELAEVDMLLLDIWIPMALPTLKLVQPHLRRGAIILTDNTGSLADRYSDLLDHLRHKDSGFINSTLPFANGLEMSIYLPEH